VSRGSSGQSRPTCISNGNGIINTMNVLIDKTNVSQSIDCVLIPNVLMNVGEANFFNNPQVEAYLAGNP
jgi:hypothetical protein